jgi:hypothetical protein
MAQPDGFSFYMPFAKSMVSAGGSSRILEGIASTEGLDQQGERLLQKGIDMAPFLDNGYIDWDHGQKQGPAFIIGKPLEARIETYQGGPALFMKGMLWEGHRGADDAWDLINAIEKSNAVGPQRRLGWSVFGAILAKDGEYLTKSVLTHMALTHQPVNVESFASIAKSLAKALGTTSPQGFGDYGLTDTNPAPGGLGAINSQNLWGGRPMPLEAIRLALWGPCLEGHQDLAGHFAAGRTGMLTHLIKCRGASPDDARTLVRDLYHEVRA